MNIKMVYRREVNNSKIQHNDVRECKRRIKMGNYLNLFMPLLGLFNKD